MDCAELWYVVRDSLATLCAVYTSEGCDSILHMHMLLPLFDIPGIAAHITLKFRLGLSSAQPWVLHESWMVYIRTSAPLLRLSETVGRYCAEFDVFKGPTNYVIYTCYQWVTPGREHLSSSSQEPHGASCPSLVRC